MFRRRIATAFSCALMGALVTPTGALAAAPKPPPPQTPVVNSWAMAPAGTSAAEPGSRPNFSYELAPGATLSDTVSLYNYGNTQLTFRIYATDAFNDKSGGFELLTGEKQPSDVGSWVKLPQANVTVSPTTRIDLPFTVSVPPDARAGDHSAAILASSTVNGEGPDGKIVALDRRAGARLYVRVAGPLQPALAVDKVHTTYRAALNPMNGSVDVRYTVRNVGNERLGFHQRLSVKSPLGKTMKQSAMKDTLELLPGNEVAMQAHFDHVTAAMRLEGQVVVNPFPVGQAKAKVTSHFSQSGHTWAIPWTLLTAVALGCLGWQARKRYRARRRSGVPPMPPAPSREPVTI